MMVTTLSSLTANAGLSTGSRAAMNTFSKQKWGGASGHASTIPSASDLSPQAITDGQQSFIIATSSAGACRAYSGTTVNPSAMMARSIATHCIELCASSPHRSPFFNRNRRRYARATSTWVSNWRAVSGITCPSRISCNTTASPLRSRLAKIWSRKVIGSRNCHSKRCEGSALLPLLTVRPNEGPQTLAHRRQIVLPAPLPAPGGKLWITALHLFFEIHSHARHQLQIPYHGPRNSVGNPLPISIQNFERRQSARFEVRIIHIHQQLL